MSERVIAALVVVGLLVIGGLTLQSYRGPAERPAVATAPVAETTKPAVRFPVPAVEAGAPLPVLGDSDAHAASLLARLLGSERLRTLFVSEHLVRRFVATVDALPRARIAPQVIPVAPPGGGFATATDAHGKMTIDAKNHLRYRPYVMLAEAADTDALVAAYRSLYPLLQDAYEELGYPDRYFNDRVVEAIDDLLAAPEVRDPLLVQPETLHQFADPDLERRSAGQKILIRMGPENAARVKARLRALRAELTSGAPVSASASP